VVPTLTENEEWVKPFHIAGFHSGVNGMKYSRRRVTYGHFSYLTFCGFIILQILMLSVNGQARQGLSHQEFRDQYLSALEEGNQQIAKQLVQQNRDHASTLAETLGSQAVMAYEAGELDSALKWFNIVHNLYQQMEYRLGEGMTLNYIGGVYYRAEDYEGALDHFQKALKIVREIEDKREEEAILNNIGAIHYSMREYEQALKYYQEALEIARNLGDKHLEIEDLNNMGMAYESIGDYKQALSTFQEALSVTEEIADSAEQVKYLNKTGVIYRILGEYKQALKRYQKALIITEEISDKAKKGRTLNNIGVIYYSTGEYQKALNYYQEALAIKREVRDTAGEATTLGNIGAIYLAMDDYSQALGCFQEALRLAKKLGDLTIETRILSNLGTVHHKTGEYEEALNHYQEVLRISVEIRNRANEAGARNNIGEVYRNIGEYKKALSYHQEALKIAMETGYRELKAVTLDNIGKFYFVTGEYEQALHYYQEAWIIRKKIGDRAGESATLSNEGLIYGHIGDQDRALDHFREALGIKREIGDRAGEATVLLNIGWVFENTGEYKQAANYYNAVLSLAKEIKDESLEGPALNNIGAVLVAAGEYQQALNYCQDALRICRKNEVKPGVAAALTNMGRIYKATGEYEQALSCLMSALTVAKEVGDRIIEQSIHAYIGDVHGKQGKWTEAVVWYKQSISLLEEIRSKAGGSEAKESFLEQYIDAYQGIVKTLFQLNLSDSAFHYAERSKARSFVELLYEASVGVKKGIDDTLLQEENRLYGRLFNLKEVLKRKPSEAQRAERLEEQDSLKHELDLLKEKIRSTNPIYAELKYPPSITVDYVQDSILKEGEVLVEYFWGEEEVYVFVIGRYNFYTDRVRILSEDLGEKVVNLVKPLYKGSDNDFDSALAYELYEVLFQPLEEKIAQANGNAPSRALIIVPDGMLYYLPFEVLVTKTGEGSPGSTDTGAEYLVYRYPLVYSPSATALKPSILHHRKTESYERDLLALAPFGKVEDEVTSKEAQTTRETPLFSQTLRDYVDGQQPLRYSGKEVETICRYYLKAVAKIGSEATEAFFRAHSMGSRYMHLATHGYLDPEQPMYSGLELSDGILQTYEIFNMDIDVDLAVLSGCQTGLGQFKLGGGYVGLSRAFFYSGTPSLLVSLWSVSDPSTAEFMTQFYKNLRRGMNKTEALREAKEWMIKEGYHTDEYGNVTNYGHPYYWAPFILIGAHE
jgi:tetratricopeptide (TPR) repeat protein